MVLQDPAAGTRRQRSTGDRSSNNDAAPAAPGQLLPPASSNAATQPGVKILPGLILVGSVATIPGLSLFPASVFLALLLLPILYTELSIHRWSRWLVLLMGAAYLTGVLTAVLLPSRLGTPGTLPEQAGLVAWLFAMVAVPTLGLWAGRHFTLHTALFLVASGAIISSFLRTSLPEWKGDLGVAVVVCLLVLATRLPLIVSRTVLVFAIVMGAYNDARSMAVIAIMAFAATFMTAKSRTWIIQNRRKSIALVIASIALLGLLMSAAMTSGLFGSEIQRRTVEQTQGGRSIISGGRTEWAASLALFRQNPFGFGIDTTPSGALQRDALNYVHEVGGADTASYYRIWVFGDRTDLHSILAGMWFHFGVGGIALAVLIAALLASAIPLAVGRILQNGVAPLYAIMHGGWDLFFSPLGNLPRFCIGMIAAFILISNSINSSSRSSARVAA